MPIAHRATLTVLSALLIGAAFLSSTGLYTIDETIYVLAAEAITRGGFTVETGFETFRSDDLRLWFMVEGPGGVVPQYPVGGALAGAPFYAALGIRGLIVLNAASAAVILWLTYGLARALYGQSQVAILAVLLLAFATFLGDYALSVWPHMLATAFVLGAFLAAVLGLQAETRGRANGLAALSGLILGLGFLVRADSILILPVVGAAALFFARRPHEVLIFGGLGLVPGVAVASWANLQKFGTLNPLSYGSSGGGTDLASYTGLIVLMAVAFAGLLVARRFEWDPRYRPVVLVVLAAVIGAAILMPAGPLRTYGAGLWALVVDMRAADDPRAGIGPGPGGTVLFWGLPKRALGQSLPWIALLAVLAAVPWRREHRAAHLGLLAFAAVWTLPFAMREWHGGFSLAMRYFLPVLPILAVLVAAILAGWMRAVPRGAVMLALGISLGLAVFGALHVVSMAPVLDIPQLFGAPLLTAIAALVMILSLGPFAGAVGARLRLAIAGAAIGLSLPTGAVTDIIETQRLRALAASSAEMTAAMPGPVMFYGRPDLFAMEVVRADSLVAVGDRLTGKVDGALIEAALDRGFRIFAAELDAREILATVPGVVAEAETLDLPAARMIEIRRISPDRRSAARR